MPTGDIMRATLEGKFNGEPVVIGMGLVSNSGAPDFVQDATTLAGELFTALGIGGTGGGYLGPLSIQYKLDSVRIQDLNPGVAAGIVFEVGLAGENDTEDAMPQICALCVTWRTGLKGKQNRGRNYLTGFTEGAANGGYWIGEIQTWAAAGFCNPLMSAFGPLGSGNYALSVVHTVSGGVRIIPPTATPILDFSIHNDVRGLRRRGAGVRISRHRRIP